jgi:hypothetical protein
MTVNSIFHSGKKKGEFVKLEHIAVETGPPSRNLIDDAVSSTQGHHPIGPDLIDDTEPNPPVLKKDVVVGATELQLEALYDNNSPSIQDQFNTNQDYLENKKHDKGYFTTLTSQVKNPSSRDASYIEHEGNIMNLKRHGVQNIKLPNTVTTPHALQAIIAATNNDSDDNNISMPIIPEA